MKEKINKWLGIMVMLYVAAGMVLYFLQERFLFHPTPLPAGHAYNFPGAFEERNIHYDSSTMFNVVRFKPAGTAVKGAVIYCHGNMDNIEYYAPFANNFTKHGYEVWMMDYPGYGKSTGIFKEELVYEETGQVYKMVTVAGFTADSIIIYGKSLGTGLATQLASKHACKKLLLECPYYSIPDIAAHFAWMYPVDWMMRHKIPTYEYIQKVRAPITIFHGTDDGTVPYSNTEKLQPLLKPGDEIVTIQGGGHNDLNDFPVMKQKLDSLLQQ